MSFDLLNFYFRSFAVRKNTQSVSYRGPKVTRETTFLLREEKTMNLTTFKNRSRHLVVSSLFLLTSILATGCGDGSDGRNIDIAGVDGPHLTLVEDNIRITMVLENLYIEGGLRYNIPKYPNSYVEISPDFESDGTLMVFTVALRDVFDVNLNQLDPQSLPGGRPLPGVASGTLPAVAFSIESFHNISVYLGPKVFGLFVPVDRLRIGQSILTARFYSSGNRVGNISIVGEDSVGENSGILLLLDMNNSTKRRLKSHMRRF